MTQTQTAPKPKLAASITNSNVSVLINHKYRQHSVHSEKGKALLEALREQPQDIEKIAKLADIALWIAAKSFGRVVIDDRDQLRLDGVPVDYGLGTKLQQFIADGFDPSPLIAFIERVSLNPDKGIADDLYAFMTKGNLPITPDGRFHAWKYVGGDYRSVHSGREPCTVFFPQTDDSDPREEVVTGQIPHPVGGWVSMPRELCNPNRQQTCSVGLHACSITYLPVGYTSTIDRRVLLVLIDPKDVTAIPTDYNQTKLRCCRYDIVAEVPREDVDNHLSTGVESRYVQPVEREQPEEAPAAPGVEGALANEPELIKDVAYWENQGCEDGRKEAVNDVALGNGYAPSPAVPEEISEEPTFRAVYMAAYVRCYEEAFAQAEADDSENEEEEPSDFSTSFKEAYDLGKEDGAEKAEERNEYEEVECDPDEGRQRFDLKGVDATEEPADEVVALYERGFVTGYAGNLKLNEFASEKAQTYGREDGEKQAQYDRSSGRCSVDLSNGERYADIPSEHDLAYSVAYARAYASKYDELAPISFDELAPEGEAAIDHPHVDGHADAPKQPAEE